MPTMHANSMSALSAGRATTCISANRHQPRCVAPVLMVLLPSGLPTPARTALAATLQRQDRGSAHLVLLASMERATAEWWRKRLARECGLNVHGAGCSAILLETSLVDEGRRRQPEVEMVRMLLCSIRCEDSVRALSACRAQPKSLQ